MPPKASDPEALRALDTIVQTTIVLIHKLSKELLSVGTPAIHPREHAPQAVPAASQTDFDVLALAHDSVSLIRAHATKISLLIVNSPFSPTALASVIRELVDPAKGPLPCLVGALQALDGSKVTHTFLAELSMRAQIVLTETLKLLEKIPKDGKSRKAEDEGFGGASRKGSVATTGVLWSACDTLTKLTKGGVPGYYVERTNEWREFLEDILSEMKSWSEEEPDNVSDDDDEEDDGEEAEAEREGGRSHLAAQDMLDDLMHAPPPNPESDPLQIRPRLDVSMKRLKLVILLFKAISKRRMATLPALSNKVIEGIDTGKVASRLDEIAGLLQRIPDHFNDLQCAFYDRNVEQMKELMDDCFFESFAVGELTTEDWRGEKDGFSEWVGKFQMELKKG